MKKITITFIGRQAGAIGINYKIKDSYKVDSVDEFKSKLFEDYDVTQIIKLAGCTENEFEEAKIINVRDKSKRLVNHKGIYLKPEQIKKVD